MGAKENELLSCKNSGQHHAKQKSYETFRSLNTMP